MLEVLTQTRGPHVHDRSVDRHASVVSSTVYCKSSSLLKRTSLVDLLGAATAKGKLRRTCGLLVVMDACLVMVPLPCLRLTLVMWLVPHSHLLDPVLPAAMVCLPRQQIHSWTISFTGAGSLMLLHTSGAGQSQKFDELFLTPGPGQSRQRSKGGRTEFVIRLIHAAGRSRFLLHEKATLLDLKVKVNISTGV